MSWPILSTITFLPLLGALLIVLLRGNDESVTRNARYIALWTTLADFRPLAPDVAGVRSDHG